jgi:hypothetical protein
MSYLDQRKGKRANFTDVIFSKKKKTKNVLVRMRHPRRTFRKHIAKSKIIALHRAHAGSELRCN